MQYIGGVPRPRIKDYGKVKERKPFRRCTMHPSPTELETRCSKIWACGLGPSPRVNKDYSILFYSILNKKWRWKWFRFLVVYFFALCTQQLATPLIHHHLSRWGRTQLKNTLWNVSNCGGGNPQATLGGGRGSKK